MKKLGTHNSATGGKLVWWQRWQPLRQLLDLTSKCQNKSIEQQLEDGIRVFNLQITFYRGKWVFSHGICIYTEELLPTLFMMLQYATESRPIYFQLVLDRNFILGQKKEKFKELVNDIKAFLIKKPVFLISTWIEGCDDYFFTETLRPPVEEKYWTLSWAKREGTSLPDKLPLPEYHAKKYNKKYKANREEDWFLMLDFYEYE